MPGTSSEPEVRLTIISPLNNEWHKATAAQLAKFPHFWDDHMLSNPIATYITIFCNPDNLVLDVNGQGVLAFHRSISGCRAVLYGVSWGKEAMRIPTARYEAAKLALVVLNIQRVEGITREDNRLARRAMEDGGMRYNGRLPKNLWYNGKAFDGVWYELDRIDFGLDPL